MIEKAIRKACVIGVMMIFFMGCVCLSSYAAENGTVKITISPNSQCVITNQEGKILDLRTEGNMGSTMTVSKKWIGANGEVIYLVEPSDSFSFDMTNGKKNISVSVEDPTAWVDVKNADKIIVSKEGGKNKVSVSGTNAEYDVTTTTDLIKDGYMTISGKTNGTFSIEDTSNAVILNGASTGSVFTCYSYDNSYHKVNDKEITLSPTADLVTITNLSGDKLKVTGATYNSVQYTVSFDSKGGSSIAPMTVNAGAIIGHKLPTKDGYTFKGWVNRYGEDVNLSQIEVVEDMTLYALWTKNPAIKYTVTFDSKGGTKVASQSVEKGNMIVKPANPTKDGYTFKGWFTKDGALWNFKTGVTGNVTLYAHWEEKVNSVSPPTGDDSGMATLLMMILGAGTALLFVRKGRRK